MKYELIMTSIMDAPSTNAVFDIDFTIEKGDSVMGYYIDSRNIILDVFGRLDRIQIVNSDYYRQNNKIDIKGVLVETD